MSKYDCTKTKDFIHEAKRTCKALQPAPTSCKGCTFQGGEDGNTDCESDIVLSDITDKTIADLQRWSDDHQEHEKTILEDFNEKYPKHATDPDGIPCTCAGYLYDNMSTVDPCPVNNDCYNCWNRPLSEAQHE